MPAVVPIAFVIGFLSAVLVNLLADYLPARRYYIEASHNPFVSRSVIPPKPGFLPRRNDGRLTPFYWWSSLIVALSNHQEIYPQHRTRRLAVEIGLPLIFAAIAWKFYFLANLPFMLLYAAVFVLIAVIDIEHRWVFLEIIIPVGIVAFIESSILYRVWQSDAIRGGLYGFGIMLLLYVFGIIFARVMGLVSGRPVTRTVLGVGDVYIATLGGLIVGATGLGLALLIMVITGAAGAIIFILNKRRQGRYRLFSAIPYGPYIVIGFAIMLYIPEVVNTIIIHLLHWY